MTTRDNKANIHNTNTIHVANMDYRCCNTRTAAICIFESTYCNIVYLYSNFRFLHRTLRRRPGLNADFRSCVYETTTAPSEYVEQAKASTTGTAIFLFTRNPTRIGTQVLGIRNTFR